MVLQTKSDAGAFDMVGNVFELTADVNWGALTGIQTLDSAYVAAYGDDYADNGATNSPQDAYVITAIDNANWTTGFRCAK